MKRESIVVEVWAAVHSQMVQGDVKRGYWWKDLNIIISTRCHTVQFKKIDGDNIAGGHSRHINT